MQRALMHYFKPYNRTLVIKALKLAGREDLIGWGGDCLVAPREIRGGDNGKPNRDRQGRLKPQTVPRVKGKRETPQRGRNDRNDRKDRPHRAGKTKR